MKSNKKIETLRVILGLILIIPLIVGAVNYNNIILNNICEGLTLLCLILFLIAFELDSELLFRRNGMSKYLINWLRYYLFPGTIVSILGVLFHFFFNGFYLKMLVGIISLLISLIIWRGVLSFCVSNYAFFYKRMLINLGIIDKLSSIGRISMFAFYGGTISVCYLYFSLMVYYAIRIYGETILIYPMFSLKKQIPLLEDQMSLLDVEIKVASFVLTLCLVIILICIAFFGIIKEKNEKQLKSFVPSGNIDRFYSAADKYIGYLYHSINDKDIKNIAITGDYGIGKSSLIKTFEKRKCQRFIRLSISDLSEIKDNKETTTLTQASIEKNLLKRLLAICCEKDIPATRFKRVPENISRLRIGLIAFFCALSILNILLIVLEPFVYSVDFFPNILEENSKKIEELKQYINLDFIMNIAKLLLFPILFFSVFNIILVLAKNYKFTKFNAKIAKGDIESSTEFDLKIEPQDLDTNFMEIVYIFEQVAKNGNYVFVFEDMDRFDTSICVPILVKLRQFNDILNDRSLLKRRKLKYTFIYVIRESIFEEYNKLLNTTANIQNNSIDIYKFFDIIIPVIPNLSVFNSATYIEKCLKKYGTFNCKFVSAISPYIADYRQINDIENEYKIFEAIYHEEVKTEEDRTELLACVLFKIFYPIAYYELRKNGSFTEPNNEFYNVLKNRYGFHFYFSKERCIRFIGGNNEAISKYKLKKIIEQIQNKITDISVFNTTFININSFTDLNKALEKIDEETENHKFIVECYELICNEHIDANIAEAYVKILGKLESLEFKHMKCVGDFAKIYGSDTIVLIYFQIIRKWYEKQQKRGIPILDGLKKLREMREIFVCQFRFEENVEREFANIIRYMIQLVNVDEKWQTLEIFKYDILEKSNYCNDDIKRIYTDCLLYLLYDQNVVSLRKKLKVIQRIRDDWNWILFKDEKKDKKTYIEYLYTLIKNGKNPQKINDKKFLKIKEILKYTPIWLKNKTNYTSIYNEIEAEINRIAEENAEDSKMF